MRGLVSLQLRQAGCEREQVCQATAKTSARSRLEKVKFNGTFGLFRSTVCSILEQWKIWRTISFATRELEKSIISPRQPAQPRTRLTCWFSRCLVICFRFSFFEGQSGQSPPPRNCWWIFYGLRFIVDKRRLHTYFHAALLCLRYRACCWVEKFQCFVYSKWRIKLAFFLVMFFSPRGNFFLNIYSHPLGLPFFLWK